MWCFSYPPFSRRDRPISLARSCRAPRPQSNPSDHLRQCRHDASAIERYGSLSDLTPPKDAQPAIEVEWKRPGYARGKGHESSTRGPLAPVAWNPTSDSYFRLPGRGAWCERNAKAQMHTGRFSGTRLGFSYVPTRLGEFSTTSGFHDYLRGRARKTICSSGGSNGETEESLPPWGFFLNQG